MEIQAKLSFKHGLIMRIINQAGVSIFDLSKMCGWKYQNLQNFISFKRLPKIENRNSLLHALQSIDPAVTELEIFPEAYDKVKDTLQTRVSNKDIPIENLLPYSPDMFAIEDHTENRVSFELDVKKALVEIGGILPERDATVLKMYYGIGLKESYSVGEIASQLNLSVAYVRRIKTKSLNNLSTDWRMHKYKEIATPEIFEEVVVCE